MDPMTVPGRPLVTGAGPTVRPGDEDAVLAVVFDAFSAPGSDGGEEVAIVPAAPGGATRRDPTA